MASRTIELRDVLNFFEYEKVRRRAASAGDGAEARCGACRWDAISRSCSRTGTPCCSRSRRCAGPSGSPTTRGSRTRSTSTPRCCPGPGELSATLMIEIEDKDRIQPVLDAFLGIDLGQHVWMQVGKEFVIPGDFEAGHSDQERGKLSAVHFVRFAFPAAAAVRAFRCCARLPRGGSSGRARPRRNSPRRRKPRCCSDLEA